MSKNFEKKKKSQKFLKFPKEYHSTKFEISNFFKLLEIEGIFKFWKNQNRRIFASKRIFVIISIPILSIQFPPVERVLIV